MSRPGVTTTDDLLKQARFRESFNVLPKGDTFKDLSTVIIIPTPGTKEEKDFLNCKECGCKNEYVKTVSSGFHPVFVDGWKNKLIKPMNVPMSEMIVTGYEVGDAYNFAIQSALENPTLKKFKYVLTIEHDNIIPYIPNTQGPLMMLFETMEKGFDVVGGLYWTKGNPSAPLIYGDPKAKNDDPEGFFRVRHDWNEGDIVECNGMGMGFTLYKMEIFKDKRLKKPWFKTCNEHTATGPKVYTQDLYFFEQIRALGYRVCVDTRVRIGHMDLSTGILY